MIGKEEKSSSIAFPIDHQVLDPNWLEQRNRDVIDAFRQVLGERLLVSSSRGDRTPLDLFLTGIRGEDVEVRRRLWQALTALPVTLRPS
jgi:hypothetical protein